MSRTWLSGRLDGVEPRAELDLLRGTVVDALEAGEDVEPLIVALAQLDAVACAELVAGPRAPADARVVRAALAAAEHLETVLPPSGLYRRLVDLAPDTLVDALRVAGGRHPGAAWIWRLSGLQELPGQSALEMALEHDPDGAPYAALNHGYMAAVVQTASHGDPASLRALYNLAPRESLFAAVAGALEAGAAGDFVAWLAAWHGPDVDPLFAAIARRLTSTEAEERLGRMAWALPMTVQELS